MTKITKNIIFLISLLTTITTANAKNDNFLVNGIFKQGGLVAITYNEQAIKKITVNNEPIVLDGDGVEYYPISRDVKKLVITSIAKNNKELTKTYPISKQAYQVQHIKGVNKDHVTPPQSFYDRISKESKEIKDSRKSNADKMFSSTMPQFLLPTNGKITGVYGSSRTYNGIEKSWHKGLDIANKEGTLITAPLKGKVVLAMRDSFYNGNLLIIDHGKKIYSIYAHLYDILVKNGDIVTVNQPIAKIGTTGRSTGPHLHFGLYIGQTAINPQFFIKD
jgi:murein DD-endopeptidase MepM/ murein hydrolase activator NlpD